MSSGTLSPSAVERAAASWRSPGVRQPLRRRMTNVSLYATLIGLTGRLEPPGRVVLVDPGVEHVEGVEAEPVRRRLQHELVPEQARRRAVARVPGGLEHDVLDRDQLQAAVAGLVDERLGRPGVH